jgi:hypothetical protein
MASKKQYIKPKVSKILLDKSIILMMKSHPKPPKPRGSGKKGINNPGYDEPAFKSPFGDKPFS